MNIIIAILGALGVYVLFGAVRRVMITRCHVALSMRLAEGDLDEAAFYFRRLIAWTPLRYGRNPSLMLASIDVRLLATALPKERMLNFFESLSSEALSLAPQSPYPYLLAAGVASQRSPGCEECQDYLSQAIATADRNLEIYRQAGEIQMAAGMYRDASRYFSTLKRIAAINRDEKGVLVANTCLARLHSNIEAVSTRTGDSETIKFIDLVIDEEQDDIDRAKAGLLKANEYARFGQYARAAETLYEVYATGKLAERVPVLVLMVRPLITVLLHSDQPDIAEKVINTASDMGVHNLDVERARLAWHRQQPEKAKEFLREAMVSGDGSVANTFKVALAHREFGNISMCIALLEQATRQSPNHRERNTGVYNPNMIDASLNLMTFFPFDPNMFGLRDVHSELADCYSEQQRYGDAAAEWRKLVRRNESNPVYKVYLANALAAEGRGEEAETYYRQAEKRLDQLLQEAPNCPLFHYAMGEICRHDGDAITAAFHYEMASCSPYAERAAQACQTLDLDDEKKRELVNKRILSQEEDSESRSRLATFLAVHGDENGSAEDTLAK